MPLFNAPPLCAIFLQISTPLSGMTRKFAIVAVLVIVVATIAGGVRSRAFRRHASTATSGQPTGEKYEADRIDADDREAITTVEERYVGEIDYEKATQAAIQGMLSTPGP